MAVLPRLRQEVDWERSAYQMKNYLFYDEETGEHFFVQEVNLWKANQTAHLFFQRPFYKCSMSDAEAEMYGYDTY